MSDIIKQFVLHHLVAIVIIGFLGSNIANAMPSPNGTGPTATWWYKWAFGVLHGIFGMIPRLIATLFPQYAKFFGAAGGTKEQP